MGYRKSPTVSRKSHKINCHYRLCSQKLFKPTLRAKNSCKSSMVHGYLASTSFAECQHLGIFCPYSGFYLGGNFINNTIEKVVEGLQACWVTYIKDVECLEQLIKRLQWITRLPTGMLLLSNIRKCSLASPPWTKTSKNGWVYIDAFVLQNSSTSVPICKSIEKEDYS